LLHLTANLSATLAFFLFLGKDFLLFFSFLGAAAPSEISKKAIRHSKKV
jgi:hypothetical protein